MNIYADNVPGNKYQTGSNGLVEQSAENKWHLYTKPTSVSPAI